MYRFLIINLFLSLLWPALNSDFNTAGIFGGFALGFVILALIEPRYGRFSFRLVTFTAYVLYAILESNIRLAWMVAQMLLRPHTQLDPGIVAIPLAVTSDMEKTVLASIITLTPGTLSVDLGRNPQGQEVLFVHSVHVTDYEQFRDDIKTKFERRLLQISRDMGVDEDRSQARKER